MTAFVDIALLGLLAVTGLALLKLRNLFAVVMLAGIYSFLSAGLFMAMDAVDVAFMEASVGVGISTVLMLCALALVGHHEKPPERWHVLPLLVVALTGAILLYASLDLPPYGRPENPIHRHVVPRYLQQTEAEVGVPNIVTAVLASYRGYDTLGETTVIFTAVVGVLLLLSGRRGGRGERAEDER